jgi:putative tryptophan/tyrosine transport system substrate-binding protein
MEPACCPAACRRPGETSPLISAVASSWAFRGLRHNRRALRAGIVTNLAHPGGNVTGTMLYGSELAGKRVDVFKQAVPALARIAVLGAGASPVTRVLWPETQNAVHSLRLEAHLFTVQDPDELSATFEAIAKDNANGMLVLADPMLNAARKTIIALAASHRLPAIYEDREFVQDGGLVSYGPSIAEMTRRSTAFVDKILKGANPGELPIEQPTEYELVINLKTAKALGLTIPVDGGRRGHRMRSSASRTASLHLAEPTASP